MSKSLQARLDRLEQKHRAPDGDKREVPHLFWEALYGEVSMDQVDPECRRLIAYLCEDSRDDPDPIEEKIQQVGQVRAHDSVLSRRRDSNPRPVLSQP